MKKYITLLILFGHFRFLQTFSFLLVYQRILLIFHGLLYKAYFTLQYYVFACLLCSLPSGYHISMSSLASIIFVFLLLSEQITKILDDIPKNASGTVQVQKLKCLRNVVESNLFIQKGNFFFFMNLQKVHKENFVKFLNIFIFILNSIFIILILSFINSLRVNDARTRKMGSKYIACLQWLWKLCERVKSKYWVTLYQKVHSSVQSQLFLLNVGSEDRFFLKKSLGAQRVNKCLSCLKQFFITKYHVTWPL